MFCTHDRRIAGDGRAEVAREQPRIGVVAAAGRRADDERDLLALVERLDRVLRRRDACGRTAGTATAAATTPHARPDRHRHVPRFVPSGRRCLPPRSACAAEGFRQGCRCQLRARLRAHAGQRGCGRSPCDALGFAPPSGPATRGRRRRRGRQTRRRTTSVGEDHDRLLWIDQPERAEDFHHARGVRAALQFQAGGRLGQRAALAGVRQAQPEQENPGDRRSRRPGRQALHGVRVRRDPDVSRREDRQVHAEGHGEEVRRRSSG